MADRIVGSLTLVQFLYLLTGGIIIYLLFNTVAPSNAMLFTLLAFPIGLFSFALAFLKIQDQPFPKFVVALIAYMRQPKQRIWHKDGIDGALTITPDTKPKDTTVTHKTIKKSQLEELIQVLDTGGVPSQPATPALNQIKKSRPILDSVRRGK